MSFPLPTDADLNEAIAAIFKCQTGELVDEFNVRLHRMRTLVYALRMILADCHSFSEFADVSTLMIMQAALCDLQRTAQGLKGKSDANPAFVLAKSLLCDRLNKHASATIQAAHAFDVLEKAAAELAALESTSKIQNPE